jgi:hypothetical protein
MPCVKSTAAGFAVGRGTSDGTSATVGGTSMAKKTSKGWDSFLPFYLQWYWSTNWLNEKSKAWYYGPRIKWMKLAKGEKKK